MVGSFCTRATCLVFNTVKKFLKSSTMQKPVVLGNCEVESFCQSGVLTETET